MIFNPNNLFYKMADFVSRNNHSDDKIILCNEGSSRSSKTYDAFHLLAMYCDHNRNKGKDIYIFRDTLTNCKDYTLKDFLKCMSIIGCKYEYRNPQKPTIKLYGNNIYFRGLADEQNAEAAPSDIIFVNEVLDISQHSMIAGWMMRCREIAIFDWNPKFSEHWVYDFEKRPNCLFTHSTYKDNKHLEKSIIKEIESYNPDVEINIINKTANKFRWQVYGLGLRASPEGLVFDNVTFVDELPEDYDSVGFGLDYGFTKDPTALVEVRKLGKKIFAKLHLYEPCFNADIIYAKIALIVGDNVVVADSSDRNTDGRRMTTDLRMMNINIQPVVKAHGSILHGIDILKRYDLNVVNNPDARKEVENYKYQIIRGLSTGIPVDKFNHFWDAFRYVVMTLYRFD